MLVSDADGIDALVQTLSTFEADEELQESVTLALLRLSFGKETEMREKIVAARALPQLVRLLGVRATALADRLQYCAAGCLGCIARGDAASRAAVREAGSLRPLLQSSAPSAQSADDSRAPMAPEHEEANVGSGGEDEEDIDVAVTAMHEALAELRSYVEMERPALMA